METPGETATVKTTDLSDYIMNEVDERLEPKTLYERRRIWGGRNLGSVYTEAQKKAVREGTFDGLYLGDYWTITKPSNDGSPSKTFHFRIMDFDYYRRCEIAANTMTFIPDEGVGNINHHLTIMPDESIESSIKLVLGSSIPMTGYKGWKENYTPKWDTNNKTWISAAFGEVDYILPIVNMVSSSLNSSTGVIANVNLLTEYLTLPSTAQIFGQLFVELNSGYAQTSVGSMGMWQMDTRKLAAIELNPDLTGTWSVDAENGYWLREPIGQGRWAIQRYGRLLSVDPTTYSAAIRPVFCLGG